MILPTLIQSDPPLYLGPTPDDLVVRPDGALISLVPTNRWHAGQLLFPMVDSLAPSALPERADLERFLARAHERVSLGATYWHCQRGMNRSGFAVAAYLALYRGDRISAAIAELRRLRSPLVLQNASFERALRTWYGDADEQDFEPVDLVAVYRELGVDIPPQVLAEPIPMPEAEELDEAHVVLRFSDDEDEDEDPR